MSTSVRTSFQDVTIAIVGGDARMLEIARLATAAGARVKAFALPRDNRLSAHVDQVGSLAAAVVDANILICPLPGLGPDGSIWTPGYDEPVRLGADVLRTAAADLRIFMGRASAELLATAKELGITIISHEADDIEALLQSVPTAEGAVKHAIGISDVTLAGSTCVSVGFGRVGQTLALLLQRMGARVTVCARNPVQRARAMAFGLAAIDFPDLPDALREAAFCFQSVPGMHGLVIDADVLRNANPELHIIELSAPPSGTDLDACRERGIVAVWARGQAGSSPRTAGANEWATITRLYAASIQSS